MRVEPALSEVKGNLLLLVASKADSSHALAAARLRPARNDKGRGMK